MKFLIKCTYQFTQRQSTTTRKAERILHAGDGPMAVEKFMQWLASNNDGLITEIASLTCLITDKDRL